MASPNSVMGVLGPIAAEDLGVTLCHEHVFIDLWREFQREGVLNDGETAVTELGSFADAGGRTVVDCTSRDLMRNPLGLADVARRTGLNIVMGTGHYRHPYLDREWFDRNSAGEIAEGIAREFEEGVADTGIKPGVIGEVGCERSWIAAAEERSFRAAARAQQLTGATITTHAAGWPVGLAQLDILESEGADPGRVIIGHCDTVPDPAYHLAIARRGAFVQFDTIREHNEHELKMRERFIDGLIDEGFRDQILLSQDICLRSHLGFRGGGGYGFLASVFVPRLREHGLSEDDIHTLLVDNPRRALVGPKS